MRALSALKQAFHLKNTEDLGKRFTPETLKKVIEAMQDYAASKCAEQRDTSQKAFNTAYDNVEDESDDMALYNMRTMEEILQTDDEPNYD